MKRDTDHTIAIYTKSENERFNELIVDIYNKYYDYYYDQRVEQLWKSRDKKASEFQVEQDFFYHFLQKIRKLYMGSWGIGGPLESNEKREEAKKKPLVTKEEIWRAIKWELDKDELDKIISFDYRYEKDDYYDFDLMIEKVHALMNGEQSINYFTAWCILLMRCFKDNMNCRNKKLLEVFYDLGDYFDGVAFMDSSLEGEKKLKECREIIATLKDYNHRICDLKNKTETDFTTNGVITYVSFGFSLNEDEELYRVCVVDEENETINYLYVPEFEYLEKINYTFLSEAEFDDLSSNYWEGYTLDTSMSPDYAIRKKPKGDKEC